jgi:hypothetical protein
MRIPTRYVEGGQLKFLSSRCGRCTKEADWVWRLRSRALGGTVQPYGHKAAKDQSKLLPSAAVGRAISLWVVLVLGPTFGLAASQVGAGEASISEQRQFVFDIAAQPLESALDAYSRVTGFETLYDTAVARERLSSTVQGTYTAVDALRMMLIGTSLSARLISQDAVTLELQQNPVRTVMEPAPDQSVHRVYFSLIQAGLERAFCRDSQVRPGGYRAVLRFSIAANGQIRQPSVVGTTGSEDRDRMIVRTLGGVSLGSAPPADLQQPIMMVILPRSSGTVLDCASVQ